MSETEKFRREAEPAFVLHTYPFRETSLVIEVLSRNCGRLALVARGARRPRSALRGMLLAFQLLSLSWYGKSELRTLHRVEWPGGLLQLRGRALICGFYLNELLLKLLPRGDAHEKLFVLYQETLRALSASEEHAPILRRFEKYMLAELGYALPLEHDTESGEPIDPARRYAFVVERGPVLLAHGESAENALELSGRTLLDIALDDYQSATTLQQSKNLMRVVINHYLGEQPLHTRQLLKDLQHL